MIPGSGHWGHGCEPGWPRAHRRLVGAVGAHTDGHHTEKKGHSTGAEVIRKDFLEEATGRQKGTTGAILAKAWRRGM